METWVQDYEDCFRRDSSTEDLHCKSDEAEMSGHRGGVEIATIVYERNDVIDGSEFAEGNYV